ncbi:MAG: 4-hydroxyphenylpyruvate dioxygenase [Phycisphaerae bacterium]|nr:4-hydroxyphenylpyruvate dioxygenase [Phycisphaerae bacterium]
MSRTVLPLASSTPKSADPLALIDVDHVRLYVGNAKQSAFFWAHAFGFSVEQYSDLTTGSRDEASYLLRQGNIRLVLTTGLTKDHPACKDVALYGDGVKDIAFAVQDATATWEAAIRNGAQSAHAPIERADANGVVTTAAIRTFGRCVHTFVSRRGNYALPNVKQGGAFMPQFAPVRNFAPNAYNRAHPCGLECVDHCVGNVELGKMNHWVQWYSDVLGFKLFKHFDDKDISTEYSALMSKVMDSGAGLIKIPINEPATGKRKSQVQEYLDFHDQTPGVQHLAFRCNDALETVAELRARGVDFLRLPDTYYEKVWDRVEGEMHAHVAEDHDRIKELGLLVDADDEGYLLQLFTMPLQDRPTLFIEIICRRGSQSFGKGNFRALFESLELEQERRGNL